MNNPFCSDEIRQSLISDFPQFFQRWPDAEFKFRDGWAPIIRRMFERWAKEFAGEDCPQVDHIKEKFGALRVGCSPAGAKAWDAVAEACDLCDVTCEVCGAPGFIRRLSWVRVLCDEHSEDAEPYEKTFDQAQADAIAKLFPDRNVSE